MPGLDAFNQILTLLTAEPRFGMLFALLVVAAIIDGVTLKIPNWLTVGGLLLGLVYSALFPSTPDTGLPWALLGAALGLLLLVPFYGLKIIGAGDVKLMTMAGAFLGVPDIAYAVLATFITGGFAALVFALYKRAQRRMLKQVLHLTKAAILDVAGGLRPETQIAPHQSVGKMPYGISIAVGTIGFTFAKLFGYW